MEHSNTNINHISIFKPNDDYLKKTLYLPPFYNDFNKKEFKRENEFITLHNINERREKILKGMVVKNINNIFRKNEIYENYNNYKVLLNIHQTDECLTFEELRCLPALSSGILIISEDVPYKESIPYSKHIIWSSVDKIQEISNDVIKNYDDYRKIYFNDIEDTFEKLKKITNKTLNKLLLK